jgi:hypothetical protein
MSANRPLWADHEALREHCEVIQYFGLGFVQVKISPVDRFHYYHPDLRASLDPEAIHNHRYDFQSFVMRGALRQELFELVPGDEFRLSDESCAPEAHESQTVHQLGALLIASFRVPAGEGYFLHYSQFHRVSAVGKTVTWLARKLPYAQPLAQVLTPIQAPQVCPFESNLTQDELWDIVIDTTS